MSGFSTIRIERDERGVATLTLARPERHNAMNAAMIGELAKAAQQVMANDDALAIGWQKGAV